MGGGGSRKSNNTEGRKRKDKKNKKAVKVEKYYSYRGNKLLPREVSVFLEYGKFYVIHLCSVGGDVQHTGSRWRHKRCSFRQSNFYITDQPPLVTFIHLLFLMSQ